MIYFSKLELDAYNKNKYSFKDIQCKRVDKLILDSSSCIHSLNYLNEIQCKEVNIRFDREQEHISYLNNLFNLQILEISYNNKNNFIDYLVDNYKQFKNLQIFYN